MMTIRKSQERGYADHGWLRSFHSFSFANYYDPQHMGFGNLRVINEDRVAPGRGFGAHPHRDMEILSYVLKGALSHKDSMGNAQTIQPGELQRMTAGTGVVHAEENKDADKEAHFFQIWLLPAQQGIAPSYAQKMFTDAQKRGKLLLIASPDGAEGSVQINANARLFAGLFDGTESVQLTLPAGRKTYVHLVRGTLRVNGQLLTGGDAALLDHESSLALEQGDQAEVLVFDLES